MGWQLNERIPMVIPEVTIDKEAGKPAFVWVAGSDDPLAQLTPTIRDDVRIERGCEVCAYTGHDLWAWGDGLSAPCPECGALDAPLVPYTDADGDAWLDGIERASARWSGGKRPLEQVTTLVMHRYSRGRHGDGPRYVQNPGGRHVSWHATMHAEGWERLSTLHLPATEIGWHAGHRRINACSIGVEMDAAPSGKVHDPHDGESIKELVSLVSSWMAMLPNLRFCVGHADILPSAAAIRGKAFPWDVLTGMGLERLTGGTLARAWPG
jgi:hypothetical protein